MLFGHLTGLVYHYGDVQDVFRHHQQGNSKGEGFPPHFSDCWYFQTTSADIETKESGLFENGFKKRDFISRMPGFPSSAVLCCFKKIIFWRLLPEFKNNFLKLKLIKSGPIRIKETAIGSKNK